MPIIRRIATKMFVALGFLAGCAGLESALASELPHVVNRSSELDRLVKDVCNKQVVLLGEDDHHGSGKTLELKIDLVERLLDECGFSAVFFESQVYDFLELDRAFADKRATPGHLADAIGGLWSTTRESDRLVSYLFEHAASGQVELRGLDPQIGGATQWYSQHGLPARLAASLPPARRSDCEAELARLTTWQYDERSPFDDAARQRLRACLTDIQAGAAEPPNGDAGAITAFMASDVSRFLDMSTGDSFNLRDRAMYDNFAWQRARLPNGRKIIVWCATIHAAKDAGSISKARVPMGSYLHQAFGDAAAAIGFSALSGRYGRMGRAPTALATARAASLEARAFDDSTDDIRYLDRLQLRAFGSIEARAIDYDQPETTHWDSLLDGLIVVRHERPPEYVRSAVPQQAH